MPVVTPRKHNSIFMILIEMRRYSIFILELKCAGLNLQHQFLKNFPFSVTQLHHVF